MGWEWGRGELANKLQITHYMQTHCAASIVGGVDIKY